MQVFFNIYKSINKLKNKNQVIISIEVEKAFDKIQHLFLIKKKNSPESGDRGKLPQHNKTTYMKNPQLTSFSVVKN